MFLYYVFIKTMSLVKSVLKIDHGWLLSAEQQKSPHFSSRPEQADIRLLVIHNISLPPGQFGGTYITDFFLGKLAVDEHPYFAEIAELRVSAHCLITRAGHIVQYVSFNDVAWHAGVSCYQGQERCNDFSIGIELEGTDQLAYTDAQYQQLAKLTNCLINTYPKLADNIAGHCDIAPERKTDPGEAFDWQYYKSLIKQD